MKLNKLVLNNIGLFRGKNEFNLSTDFSSSPNKPIILFGGLNGTGKTTIFDSVKLCLYGKEMAPGLSENRYQDYLINKIHHSNSLLVQPNHASIEIEFQYSRYGEINTYNVKREWERNGKKVYETMDLEADGKPIDEINKENWQDFIKELIPPGLTQLFFFDGEKVQKVMASNNIEFKNSIKRLLGLDIIERLQSDLKIYKTKSLNKISSKESKEKIDKIQEQEKLSEKKINEKKTQSAAIENEILKTDNLIKSYREKIAAQGEGFLRKKEQLVVEQRTIEKQIEMIKEQIKEIASGLLPLCIASNYSKKLKDQLSKEREHFVNKIAGEKLKEKKVDLIEKLNSLKVFSAIEIQTRKELVKFLNMELDNLFKHGEQDNIKEIFEFSPSHTNSIISSIDTALDNLPANLEKLTLKYESNFRKLERIYSELEKVPDEELVKPMYEMLNQLNQEKGGFENEKSHLQKEIATLEKENDELKRKIQKFEKSIEETRGKSIKSGLVNKAQDVLKVYKRELALKKIENLKTEFLSIFGSLHQKKDLINCMEVSPETFDIQLFDSKNKSIPKDLLSSGEKEIYAISLLAALTRVSGQNLPYLIDMPLGRLDKEHRGLIINNFIPYASHQMILFSTNTEIDKELFKVLTPYISRSYSLDYDNEEKQTFVKERYFWK
jgi:DNA sulfur modification protein DndD